MKKTFKSFLVFSLALSVLVSYIPCLPADEDPGQVSDTMDMVSGDIQNVPVSSLTRVSVTNPEVADISDAQNDHVSLLAKKAGTTVLFLWGADGKRTITIRVVNENLAALKARITKILSEAGVNGVSMEENLDIGKLVLTGDLSKEDKDRMWDILEPYSDNLVNFVKEEKNEDLVQVDMQIVEISTSLEKNLGILWGNSSSGTGAVGSTGNPNSGTSGSGVTLGYNEQGVPFGDKFKDLFKIGNFERTSPLQATVNALIQEGKARLISKPRLVVISGKQASFLVGGEIPIQNTTTSQSGGVQQSSTTYTQYGVNLSVTPTIREGKIDVLLNVDIRDIDASTPITGGNVAFITRTASTDLLMENKQTIALAGLIKYEDNVNVTEVPYLSKIPIVGLLFRNRQVPADSNTEMVIILTPTVLTEKKFEDHQLAMPTPEERSSWHEIDSRYEHEPIVSQWPASQAAPAADASNPPADQMAALPAVTAYARMVQEKISRSIAYPQEAMTNSGMAGTVKLRLHILKDGSLDSEQIVESSGSSVLDEDAAQAAKTAAPFNAFSTGIDQDDLIFTIPIVYNKLISGNQPPEKVRAS